MPTFKIFSELNYLWSDGIISLEQAEAQVQQLNQMGSRYRHAYFEQWPEEIDERYKEEKRIEAEGITLFEHDGSPYRHYPILVDKNMISFFDRDQFIKRTEMRLGRYLRKFMSHEFDDNKIADIAARYGIQQGDAVLKFATTREEIARVYVEGPESCMSHSKESFNLSYHPTEVYASPDLMLAYLERDGEITARVLVSTEKKQYSRIYGDEIRLKTLIEAQGYKYHPFMMANLRLLVICDRHNYVIPYIDGPCIRLKLDDNCEYWIVQPPQEVMIYANETSGYVRV